MIPQYTLDHQYGLAMPPLSPTRRETSDNPTLTLVPTRSDPQSATGSAYAVGRVHSYDDVYFALQHIDHDETITATDVATNVDYVEVRDKYARTIPTPSAYFKDMSTDRDDSDTENQSLQRPLTSSSFRPIVDRGPDEEVCSFTRTPLRPLAPSRQHSRASTRPASHVSGVDLNWIGDFVIGVTQDASSRERRDADERRRLTDLAQARERQLLEQAELALKREQRQFELRVQEQEKQAELALKRAETEQQIALERENKIREDMRQLAALEARNALLEQRLRDAQFKQEIAGDATVASTPSPLSAKKEIKTTLAAYPPSPELDLTGNFVHSQSRFMTDTLVGESFDDADAPIQTTQQLSQDFDSYTVVPSSKPIDTKPTFVAPSMPPVRSTHFIPASSIANATPELLQTLPVIATPSGPAVQAISLTSQKKDLGSAPAAVIKTETTAFTQPTVTTAEGSSLAYVSNTSAPVTAVASVSSASNASSTSPSSVPIVVINTPQAVRPYSGNTSWASFRDHFQRVAKVNKWETDEVKAQHLQLALEGAAAETLKELNENSSSLYQDIWDALKRRFGEVDEARVAMTKFEHRKQHEAESVVEFEQALRALYRLAWPKATEEQKNVALKARFEEGINNPEMQQYLRLHATADDFCTTVQKARRFASTTETQRPRKSVRIATPPPAHDSVQAIQGDTSLHVKVDKIESLIRSLTVDKPSARSVTTARQSPKPPPASRPKPEQQRKHNNNSSSYTPQHLNGQTATKQPYAQRFNGGQNRQFVHRQWTNGNANYANLGQTPVRRGAQSSNRPRTDNPQNSYARPRRRGTCWVCGELGCHSSLHDDRPQTPPSHPHWNNHGPQTTPAQRRWTRNPQQTNRTPYERDDICWVCGDTGCRSWLHNNEGSPAMQTVPSPISQSQQGNGTGTRPTGNRGPNQPARPASH